MINPHRGDVEVVVNGEPRVGRLTLGAIAALETRLEAGSLQALAKRFEGGQMSMQDVLEILSVSLDIPVPDLKTADIESGATGAAQAAALLLARGFGGVG